MIRENSLDIPKETTGDLIYSIVKGAADSYLSGGGIIAELIVFVVQPSIEKRREKWMENVKEAILSLERRGENFSVQNLRENEEFISILFQTSQAAIKTHQLEKIKYLRNALENCYLSNLEYDVKDALVKILDFLSPSHILVLKFFTDRMETLRDERHFAQFYDSFKESVDINPITILEFVFYSKDLKNRDLLLISDSVSYPPGIQVRSPEYWGTNSGSNENESYVQVTEIGKLLIDFIKN